MALQHGPNYIRACELVKAGLESGSIKLLGTGHADLGDAQKSGAADAQYLKSLLEGLAEALPK